MHSWWSFAVLISTEHESKPLQKRRTRRDRKISVKKPSLRIKLNNVYCLENYIYLRSNQKMREAIAFFGMHKNGQIFLHRARIHPEEETGTVWNLYMISCEGHGISLSSRMIRSIPHRSHLPEIPEGAPSTNHFASLRRLTSAGFKYIAKRYHTLWSPEISMDFYTVGAGWILTVGLGSQCAPAIVLLEI